MRRDTIDVTVSLPADGRPTLHVDVDDPAPDLAARLSGSTGEGLAAEDVDVTVRRIDDERGVLALADRLTGEFVIEAEVDLADVEALVRSIRESAEDPEDRQYRVRLTDADGKSVLYDKRILLVYGADGGLSRTDSLIPGSVEL